MVLCHSRLMYLEFTLAQSMEQFFSCHQHALEFFGLVPARIMIDNLKTGVLHHRSGEPVQFNPRYLDFADHYGFKPVACAPRKGNQKGRVENGVGYIKKNFLAGLQIPSFAALHPAARQWLADTANLRIHGETQSQTRRTLRRRKVRSQAPARCALRLFAHQTGQRHQPLPHSFRGQPLFGPPPVRLPKAHRQNLSRPVVPFLPRKAHCHPSAQL